MNGMTSASMLTGCLAALISAAAWALGDILWSRIGEKISPYSMNIGKGIIGSFYFFIVLLVIGARPVTLRDVFFLGMSGVFGIAIGDTLFFASLRNLGPRLASLLGSLIPVCIALSAFIFLGERPSYWTLLGISLTVAGLTWVLMEHAPSAGVIKNRTLGIKCGVMAVVCTTAGVLLAKVGLKSSPTIEATSIRLIFGVLGLMVGGLVSRQLKVWVTPIRRLRLIKDISFAVFVVVFGGFWMSIVALKYTDASVAGALTATTPLFMLPLSAIMQKEKISFRACLGAFIAVTGVILIMTKN